MVSQKKEWGEILTNFETKNRYVISDMSGRQLYWAGEEGGSVILRWILKALRPFTIVVLAGDDQVVIRIRRPFRFYFHKAEIVDAHDRLIGTIERRFSVLRRNYTVFNPAGEPEYQLFGPLLKPWTFQIKNDETEYGKITKKWSGLLKEGFTDADNFGVIFPEKWDVELKALFLGAVFLIDFVHFENTE